MNRGEFQELSVRNFLFWLSRKIDYPLVPPDLVQINFTFRCNLSCSMCSMEEQRNFLLERGRETEIDLSTYKKIVRETKELGARGILLIGGEPFVSKDLFSFVKEARSNGINPIIVTNGTLLDEENILRCFEHELDWLSISIDAATEQSFEKIRGAGTFKRVIGNIEKLNEMKKARGKPFPKIVAVITLMNSNLEELPEVIGLCRRLKIERVILQPVVIDNADQSTRDFNSSLFVPPERSDVLDRTLQWLIAYKKADRDNFDFISNDVRHIKLIGKYFKKDLKSIKMSCYAGYNRLQITQDHRIYFCIPPNKKYDASFGDIKKSSLKELWFSEDARIRRKLIKQCRVPCLQWCAYRDDFLEWAAVFQKLLIKEKNNGH